MGVVKGGMFECRVLCEGRGREQVIVEREHGLHVWSSSMYV